MTPAEFTALTANLASAKQVQSDLQAKLKAAEDLDKNCSDLYWSSNPKNALTKFKPAPYGCVGLSTVYIPSLKKQIAANDILVDELQAQVDGAKISTPTGDTITPSGGQAIPEGSVMTSKTKRTLVLVIVAIVVVTIVFYIIRKFAK